MVPFAKTRLGLDEASLGLILLALGGGSMVAMPLAGAAIHYWGSRPVIAGATLLSCVALPLLAIPATPLMLASTLFAFGAALGAMDVAMNAQAIVVQHAAERPIMSGFHALFSVGGLVGAGLVTVLLRVGLTPFACVTVIAVGLLGLGLSQTPAFLPDRGEASGSTFTLMPRPPVLLLGALCFISFLAEGAILDWSAVFLRDERQVDISIAGIGYAAFSVAMIIGRLTGDHLTHRAGVSRVLQAGGLVAAIGFVMAAAIPHSAGAIAGFVVFGAGVANIVPVLFSAAGRVEGVPAGASLATVTTIAYAGLLVGPALIGLLADATSLPMAFVVVAAMLGMIAASARRVT